MARIKPILWQLVLWVLASPVLLCITVRRGWKKVRFFRVAWLPHLYCECGAQVSLIGLWKCSCGFTYRGHLVTLCPVCSAIPKVVRCYECGVTRRLPDPW